MVDQATLTRKISPFLLYLEILHSWLDQTNYDNIELEKAIQMQK